LKSTDAEDLGQTFVISEQEDKEELRLFKSSVLLLWATSEHEHLEMNWRVAARRVREVLLSGCID